MSKRQDSVAQEGNRNSKSMKLGKRAAGAAKSNDRFVQGFVDFLNTLRNPEVTQLEVEMNSVMIGRVLKPGGFGDFRVMYTSYKGGVETVHVATAKALGKFGGAARKGVRLDRGEIVMIHDTAINGASRYQIVGVVQGRMIDQIENLVGIDPRVLDVTLIDEEVLLRKTPVVDDGFYFGGDTDVELKIDDI